MAERRDSKYSKEMKKKSDEDIADTTSSIELTSFRQAGSSGDSVNTTTFGVVSSTQQDTASPSHTQQDTPRSGPLQPDTPRPGPSQPDTSHPGPSQPDTPRPGPSQPDTPRPGPSQPDTSRPGPSQPDTSRPGPSQPDPLTKDTPPPLPQRNNVCFNPAGRKSLSRTNIFTSASVLPVQQPAGNTVEGNNSERTGNNDVAEDEIVLEPVGPRFMALGFTGVTILTLLFIIYASREILKHLSST